MIDTRQVAGRRKLRFESFDDAIRDAEALVAAEQAGALQTLGNWTLGQAIGHIAYWADAPFDGYPTTAKLPWILRVVLPWFKNYFLNNKLPPGGKIPDAPEGTFGVEKLATNEALDRLRRAFARMAAQPPTHPNPVFGVMKHEEWIKLNLRHAELHLSFFVPG